jgi:probable rRNA maturation factor
MKIQFINSSKWGIKTKGFGVYIERLKKYIPDPEGVLNVVFVDDDYIHSLNKEYRKKDKPTDVLSFSYIDSAETGDNVIGEIYISVPTAKRQAPEYHNTLQDELNKLFVHGMLHIFGYDHENDADYEKMAGLEGKILS